MTEQNNDILFDVRDGVGRVTFNRPQARNAFTFEMYERLAAICEEANENRAAYPYHPLAVKGTIMPLRTAEW